MRSDSDIFGGDLLNGLAKKKVKPGESGNEADDYEPDEAAGGAASALPAGSAASFAAPELEERPDQKMPKSYNDDAGGVDPATGMPRNGNTGVTGGLAGAGTTAVVTDTPAAPAAAAATAKSQVNTDGYAAPAVVTARAGQPPPGYDQTKWADAAHQTPKYAVGGIVAKAIANGTRDMTPELLAEINAAYPGTRQVDRGTLNIPGLGEVQVINDGQVRWDPAGSFAPADAGTAAPASTLKSGADLISGANGSGGFVGGNMVPTTGTAATTPASDALAKLLAGSLGGDVAANIGSDPAVSAFKRQNARQFAGMRADLAEQAAQNGTASSGGNDGRIRGLGEKEAEQLSDFTGRRVADATNERRQEITTALQFTQNADQFLKSLDLSRDRLTQEQSQFLMNLSAHRDEFLSSLGLSYAQLNGQQRLALQQMEQQSDQFNKNLGFNYDQLEADQNYRALLAALQQSGG